MNTDVKTNVLQADSVNFETKFIWITSSILLLKYVYKWP